MPPAADTIQPPNALPANGDAAHLFSKTASFSFLKTAQLRKVSTWSFNYLSQNQVQFSGKFKQVKIGTFLTRRKNAVKIEDDKAYKQVTIRLFGKGAKVRSETLLLGKEIKTKSQFLVSEGQFIFSRIDARNGAFAIAPKEIDGAIVTNDFPVYDIDQNLIDPNYFALLISTEHFTEYFQGLSSGTTNRQRINDAEFLDFAIPLPPIETQKKLVARYNAKTSQAAESEARAEKLEKDIENYLLKELGIKIQATEKKNLAKFSFLQSANLKELSRWSVDFLDKQNTFDEIRKSKYEVVSFEELITFAQYGISEKPSEIEQGVPMLRMNNILEGKLNLKKLKYLNLLNDRIQNLLLQKNDFLFNRTNSKELVGKTAIFDIEGAYVFASYLIRLKLNQAKSNIYFINYLFNSSVIRRQIDIISRQVLGQANVNLTELKKFLIPLPPLKIQNKIIKHINSEKAKIKQLTSDADNLRTMAKIDFEAELFEK